MKSEALNQLRKLIREEVRAAIKEELKDVLTEAVIIASEAKSTPVGVGGSGILNSVQPHVGVKSNYKPSFSQVMAENASTSTGNPLLDILNETAQAGEWRSLNGDGYGAADAVSWNGGMPAGQARIVSSVEEMIGSKTNAHAQDITQVTIDAVPDFSGLMGKLKERGNI